MSKAVGNLHPSIPNEMVTTDMEIKGTSQLGQRWTMSIAKLAFVHGVVFVVAPDVVMI